MSGNSPQQPAAAEAVRLERLEQGALWRVTLATPPANILDAEKIAALDALFAEARETQDLKAVLLEGEGEHFCFGASVQEHLPDQCKEMLHSFHGLFHRILRAEVPVLAAVRGRCLGGGLELASFANRLFASPDASLGQPEIVLGVFAPVATVFLTERIGRARAEDICLSGRTLDADEALRVGLVDQVDDDPAAAALEYASRYFLPRSASSLRMATRALRRSFALRFMQELRVLENIYLWELMHTHDAVEGLEAFLEKRDPAWRNA